MSIFTSLTEKKRQQRFDEETAEQRIRQNILRSRIPLIFLEHFKAPNNPWTLRQMSYYDSCIRTIAVSADLIIVAFCSNYEFLNPPKHTPEHIAFRLTDHGYAPLREHQNSAGRTDVTLRRSVEILASVLLDMIEEVPKFGNDIPEVDAFARDVAYTYTRPLETFKNPRGGMYQAGLYPVSANVPLGAQTGATPDGRLAHTPVADGVSPSAGKDVKGPTAAANSVSKLDHYIASNGTLFNQKFHPSALNGREGLENFVALIRSYFDQKGSHMQFNVVSRETLLDAQKNPEQYKHLVVRVAGYSALFTTLSKSLQDDIINRTEQGW